MPRAPEPPIDGVFLRPELTLSRQTLLALVVDVVIFHEGEALLWLSAPHHGEAP